VLGNRGQRGSREVFVFLVKTSGMDWWKNVILRDPETDVPRVRWEDPEIQCLVERFLIDERRKMGIGMI
jgi:hypothetical protein